MPEQKEVVLGDRYLEIPKTAVRRIMKMNDEVANISADAVVVTAKAGELFLAALADAAKDEVVRANRKTIKVDDIFAAIMNNQHKFEFLNEAFVSGGANNSSNNNSNNSSNNSNSQS
eukprot:gene3377-3702_t